MSFIDEVEVSLDEWMKMSLEERSAEAEPVLSLLPDEHLADLLFLYFVQRKRISDIAVIFGVSRRTIGRRIDKGLDLLKLHVEARNR